MTLTDNPRVDIEKRIKQLYRRMHFVLVWRGLGSIDYENGVAARFYPSLMPRKKREQAGRMLRVIHKEINLKEKQLKSF